MVDPFAIFPEAEGVYVLECDEKKFYVGYSTNLRKRIRDHYCSKGARWTRKYRPILVEKTIPGGDKAMETQVTMEYMRLHGWENVRGANYVEVEMNQPPFEFEDGLSCFECRGPHTVRNCPEVSKKRKRGHKDEEEDDEFAEFNDFNDDEAVLSGERALPLKTKGSSSTSGSSSVKASTSKASTSKGSFKSSTSKGTFQISTVQSSTSNFKERPLKPEPKPKSKSKSKPRSEFVSAPWCSRCGRTTHSAKQCFASTHADGSYPSDVDGSSFSDYSEDEDFCSKCGRSGHRRAECFARRDVEGYAL